jgi:periplasmic copper chaperone A
VSRRHQSMLTRTPLSVAALVAACCAAVLALAGCGAGQVAQTGSQVSAIDGASGDVGDIALRDVLIPYPPGDAGGYPAGSRVPLQLTIVNQGTAADVLISVRTPAARQVLIGQEKVTIPAGMSLISTGKITTDATATPTARPVSPLVAGELSIVLADTTRAIRAGLTTDITFVFQNAGSVTIPVPVGPDDSERTPLQDGEEH